MLAHPNIMLCKYMMKTQSAEPVIIPQKSENSIVLYGLLCLVRLNSKDNRQTSSHVGIAMLSVCPLRMALTSNI